jgi:hypothetical protein
LADSAFALSGLQRCAPAGRGDVQQWVDSRPPGVMLLCDGIFKSRPAVSHEELCHALDAGWQVWGVSSLGAIRAHEMRDEGMRGFGWVYQQFSVHADFTDDELALLHLPGPGYESVTEPLVNLRYALQQQGPSLGLAADQASAALDELGRLWFGERSLQRMQQALCGAGRVPTGVAASLLSWMQHNPVKALDLKALLAARPWQPGRMPASPGRTTVSPPPAPGQAARSSPAARRRRASG